MFGPFIFSKSGLLSSLRGQETGEEGVGQAWASQMTPPPGLREHVAALFRNGRLWMDCPEYIYHCAANSVCQAAMSHTDLVGRYFWELGIGKQKRQSEAWMGFSEHHYFWLLSVFVPRKHAHILSDVEKLFLTEGLQRDAPSECYCHWQVLGLPVTGHRQSWSHL